MDMLHAWPKSSHCHKPSSDDPHLFLQHHSVCHPGRSLALRCRHCLKGNCRRWSCLHWSCLRWSQSWKGWLPLHLLRRHLQ